jgi:quinoprotein glucose dehydrogenase
MLFPFRIRAAAVAAGLFFCLFTSVRAVEIEVEEGAPTPVRGVKDPGTRVAEAEIAPASDEAEQALERMKLPAGLKASLWAAEPMLANPVAFNIDEQGRIFVAETYRYRSSVLDIRDYLWMLEDDLATRTIEEREKLVAEKLGAEGTKELSIESERLRLIEDRDGDGKADHSGLYAEGFNSVLDGIASGVVARRGEVWFTNIPSLWKFTGRDKAETREELSRGYGVRFNYTGHDFHGPTFGPDGKLYFSCGDRGTHVTTKEGRIISVPDTGAIFRCNPDGSELELFAYGLRNPQSLLFTENGDLFTGDNDSDQGDEERLVHVVEGGDSGWRIGYQFAPLGEAGPWNSEKMWHLRHDEQAAYFLPPVSIIEDGPSGVAYYPGTGLNPSFAGKIFITHFKGSIASSGIYTYDVKPDGASYAIADSKPFLTNALPTDVRFGPDGRLYYSDWAEGWPKSKKGRIYAIYDPKHVATPLVKETKTIIASDFTKKTPAELARLLAHADWRVRLEAQYTLAERGAPSISVFEAVLKQSAPGLAGLHATWGLGQLAAKHPEAIAAVQPLLQHTAAEVRAQAAKVLGDRRVAAAHDALIAALRDENARVRFFAAQSLGKLGRAESAPALLALLRENDDKDLYLRHAAVMGLVGTKNLAALAEGARSESRAERMGVLLALRRLERPEIADFLADRDPLIVREAAIAINDAPINGALSALAALLEQPLTDERVIVRAINANYRLGEPANAKALAGYAARADAPAGQRSEALAQLALWPKPPARDRVVGVFRPLPVNTRDASPAREAVAAVAARLLAPDSPEAVQTAAVAAFEALNVEGAADALVAVVRDNAQTDVTRAAALKTLNELKDPRVPELVTFAGQTDAAALRLAALPMAARLSPEKAAPLLERLAKDGNAAEQKAAYATLAKFNHPSADQLLASQLQQLAAGKIPAAAQLELLEAASRRSDPRVKQLLAEREAALANAGDPLAPYRVALEGGSVRRGRRIFLSQPVMSCVRCHMAGTGAGGNAGPNLAMIGAKHDREYLLESVVKPNARIAPGFDSVVLTLNSGKIVGGTVAEETPAALSLRDADGKISEIKKSDIAKREGAPSSMPEIYGAVLTKTELRDVVEYLASLTEADEDSVGSDVPRAIRHLRR